MKRSTEQLIYGLHVSHGKLHDDIPYWRDRVAMLLRDCRQNSSCYRLLVAWRIYQGWFAAPEN